MLENIKIDKNRPVVFLHIPKTAGTNFTFVMENNYPKRDYLYHNYSIRSKKNKELVAFYGHWSYEYCINLLAKDPIIFVFLREPGERVVSHYAENVANRYIKPNFKLESIFNRPEVFLNENNFTENVKNICSYRHRAVWTKDFYCHYLSGTALHGKPQFAKEETFNEVSLLMDQNKIKYLCKDGYREFDTIFGLTEQFDKSLKLFQKIAGWKTIAYREKSPRRAFSKKRRYECSDDLVKKIREYNQYDIALYKKAKEIFDKELKFWKIE